MTWSHPTYEEIASLLGRQTGLGFSPIRQPSAELGIRRAMARAGLSDPEAYRQLLLQRGDALDDLVVELTVGETWFFREPEQLAFIRREVLPDLRRRAQEAGTDCRVRAWSAGCASGEEAYTLSILLHEERLAEHAWLLATDISRAALTKARQAVYTSWSLRGGALQYVRPYLRPRGTKWVVADEFRRSVTLARLNLALDVYPSLEVGVWGMDLILCRNVLIYFDAQTVEAVAARLFASLAPGGWLFTASSDPPLGRFAPFECVLANEGVFYRRPPLAIPAIVEVHPPPVPPAPTRPEIVPALPRIVARAKTPAPPPALPIPPDPLVEARAALSRGDYARVIDQTASLTANAGACALRLRALANLDLARAEQECAAAVHRHPLHAELHYLHGTLLLGVGKTTAAARAVRRALYLDRSLAAAHCALGAILEQGGDEEGARRAYRNARDLCAARPADEEVPLADGESAGRLAEAAQARLELLGKPTHGPTDS
jgi:chemotaxis protein methyltransferase CheR